MKNLTWIASFSIGLLITSCSSRMGDLGAQGLGGSTVGNGVTFAPSSCPGLIFEFDVPESIQFQNEVIDFFSIGILNLYYDYFWSAGAIDVSVGLPSGYSFQSVKDLSPHIDSYFPGSEKTYVESAGVLQGYRVLASQVETAYFLLTMNSGESDVLNPSITPCLVHILFRNVPEESDPLTYIHSQYAPPSAPANSLLNKSGGRS